MVERVDEAALKKGFEDLDDLAKVEYHQTLAEVASATDATQSAVRVGRLVGVILKEPFATSADLKVPSHRTAAYRSWTLDDETKFNELTAQWQYAALGEMRRELVSEDPYIQDWSTYEFASFAQDEKGFFGYFARALRRYICGDAEIRRKVEEALKESAKAGNKTQAVTPEVIMGSGGLALGVFLVGAVPLLGMVGAPVIAAIVVILYRLGAEGYCDWANQLRTDEDEKH